MVGCHEIVRFGARAGRSRAWRQAVADAGGIGDGLTTGSARRVKAGSAGLRPAYAAETRQIVQPGARARGNNHLARIPVAQTAEGVRFAAAGGVVVATTAVYGSTRQRR